MENQNQEAPQVTSNYQWLRTLGIGFGIVSFGIAIGVIGYILGTRNSQKVLENQQSAVVPTAIPTPTPIPDETANWKTYVNNEHKLSFKYPQNFAIENNSKPPQFFFSLKSTDQELVFSVEPSSTPSFASRLKPINTVLKSNISWTVYPDSTYCDAGDCGKTSASYETTRGEWRYAFLLRKVTPTEIIDQILSTFQFTDQ